MSCPVLRCSCPSSGHFTGCVSLRPCALAPYSCATSSFRYTGFNAHHIHWASGTTSCALARWMAFQGWGRWRNRERMRQWWRKHGIDWIKVHKLLDICWNTVAFPSGQHHTMIAFLLWLICGMSYCRFHFTESPSVVLNIVWKNGLHIIPVTKQGVGAYK